MARPRGSAAVHPGAWWTWALCLAVTAVRTTNLLVLVGVVVVALLVSWACATVAVTRRGLRFFLMLGVWIVGLRLLLQMVFAPRIPGTVLFTLPGFELPKWVAGISIGGAVTAESLLAALVAGGRLATVLICFGVVSTLASPARVLRSLPAVLYEAGATVTVAVSSTPQAIAELRRVRQARLLRGRPVRGPAGLRGLVMPVLEGALDRAITTAASMDARGYGRRGNVRESVRAARVCLVLGLGAVLVGTYGLLGGAALEGVAVPLTLVGAVVCGVALWLAGRGDQRSRYRPQHWTPAAFAVVACGLAPVLATFLVSATALEPPVVPLRFPPLPWPFVVALVVAVLPALIAPATPPTTPATPSTASATPPTTPAKPGTPLRSVS
jgi:energy-coupling factor transport system permease protein